MMRGVGGLIELVFLLLTVGAITVAVIVILLLARSAVRGPGRRDIELDRKSREAELEKLELENQERRQKLNRPPTP